MDKNQMIAIIALVVAFASLFTAFLYEPSSNNEETAVFTVYFGMTDVDGDPINVTVAKDAIEALCESHGLGFTSYQVYGGYLSDDVLVTNDTLVYIFALSTEETVRALASDVKSNLSIHTVMFEESYSAISFLP